MRFRALGTYAFLATRRDEDLAVAESVARQVLRDVDETCSRFREDSDLSRVNQHPGSWVEVDDLLVAAVRTALEAAHATDGLVNPLLGRQLVQLGYDRDLGLLSEESQHSPDDDVWLPADPHDWRLIYLDDGAVRIPGGTALDLGCTAKAWAADLIVSAFTQRLRGSAIISLGGDIAIGGAEEDPEPWPISVSTLPDGPVETVVSLDRGGLATSSTQVRRWSKNGVGRHHLLDPRTSQPAVEVWTTVTATGATCVAANTASTAAVVLGEGAPDWLSAQGVTARLVGPAGVRLVGEWPASHSPDLGISA